MFSFITDKNRAGSITQKEVILTEFVRLWNTNCLQKLVELAL